MKNKREERMRASAARSYGGDGGSGGEFLRSLEGVLLRAFIKLRRRKGN